MKLKDLANVKTGLVISRKKSKLEQNAIATYKLLTLNNVSDDGIICDDSFEEFFSNEELDKHYFTEVGDVLLRLSQPFTSIYIDDLHENLLIPSYFAVIKVNSDKLLPQFLSWYLNTSYIKHELERAHSGSRILSTNQKAINHLPISLIPIEKQKAIINLYNLHQREKLLLNKLIKEKEILFHGITQKLLGGFHND